VNGVDFTASFVPFRFSGLPSVAQVAPSAGPLDGRTELTVTGSGFPATGELFCLVDGVRVPLTVHSSSQGLPTPPPRDERPVSLRARAGSPCPRSSPAARTV